MDTQLTTAREFRNIPLPRPWVKPAYGAGCYSDVPQFIESLFDESPRTGWQPEGFDHLPRRYSRVVVVLLDAFGWSFLEARQEGYYFLRRFVQEGSVSRLTSQFPSTTSAHVTTLYSGLPVGQHGVYEWFFYEPVFDRLIAPLRWSFAGDEKPETLLTEQVSAKQVLPQPRFLEGLQRSGVATVAILPREFAFSTYATTMLGNAELVSYATLPEALVNLSHQLERQSGPACFFLYAGSIDTICHKHGPDSPQLEAELDACLTILGRWMERDLLGRIDDTLLLVLADHGQVAVDPATTIYLNRLPGFERLARCLRVDGRGRPLVPAGSCRDMFLYVDELMLEEAEDWLVRALEGRASVVRVADLIAGGFFGPLPVSADFQARAGNLVILPADGETVWWYEKDRFEQVYYGHHGGLSPGEIEIPLLLYPFTA